MSLEQIAAALWRDRLLFLAALAVSLTAVVAVTLSLPKSYDATATLYVGVGKSVDDSLAYDTALGEQLARTYTSLAANANVAEEVRRSVTPPMTRRALQERMSFAPVERTQLLEITAQGDTAEQAQSLANTYARVFVSRVGRQFERGETQSKISLNEAAATPTAYARPNPPLYIGLGAVLSLLLAAAAVVVRDRLDDRIRVADDDDTALGQAVVARIPEVDGRRGAKTIEVSDAFRLLKTNIDFTDGHPSQVLMVTSPSPAEGKSTIASRLALSAVADGERVVVIEADLRRPGLGRGFDHALAHGVELEHSSTGLTNYLVGAATVHDVVIPQPNRPGLFVIWSGPLPPNPSSLLRSRRLAELIDHLRLSYDRIIVDTPPISVGADASVCVSRVDATLLVVDVSKTKRPVAQAGLNQLEKANARLLGLILNRAATPSFEDYGYYGGYDTPSAPEPVERARAIAR